MRGVRDGDLGVLLAGLFAPYMALLLEATSGPLSNSAAAGPYFWTAIGAAGYWFVGPGRAPAGAVVPAELERAEQARGTGRMRHLVLGDGEEVVRSRSSARSRINLLIGDKRRSVVALSLCAIVSGFTEAATLALIAQIAASLVKGAKNVQVHIGPINVDAPISTLILIAFGFTLLRITLQIPMSTLPAQIAADVQSRLRRNLFDAFTHASWEVQALNREGQLQETMTSQVISATGGALQTTGLITASFTFIVLIASALALNAVAAVIVGVTTVMLFGLLRPLRARGVRCSRSLSKAQVGYAAGIAESIRVAEESQVFGVTGAQRSRIDELVHTSRAFYFRTALLVETRDEPVPEPHLRAARGGHRRRVPARWQPRGRARRRRPAARARGHGRPARAGLLPGPRAGGAVHRARAGDDAPLRRERAARLRACRSSA